MAGDSPSKSDVAALASATTNINWLVAAHKETQTAIGDLSKAVREMGDNWARNCEQHRKELNARLADVEKTAERNKVKLVAIIAGIAAVVNGVFRWVPALFGMVKGN